MIHLMQGNVAKAKTEVEQALTKEPSNPDVYVLLTKTSIMSGNPVQARKWIKALESIPNRSEQDFELLRQEFKQTFRQEP